MLKVFVMIDCNLCGQVFDRVTTSCDRDPTAWKALSLDLEYKAENCGWTIHRAAHHCAYCISDVMLPANQTVELDDTDEPF